MELLALSHVMPPAHPFDFDYVHSDASDDKLKEECGVFGVVGVKDAANFVALGLHALQHRGQEAGGIVSHDPEQGFNSARRFGYVRDNFTKASLMETLPGPLAIGHVRYSTAGSKGAVIRDVQPFFGEFSMGGAAIAHNGNITNADALRKELIERGSIFQSSSDSECIIHLMARSLQRNIPERMEDALRRVEGAFSIVAMTRTKLIGVRDPLGVRPLVLGKLDGNGWVLSSETCPVCLQPIAEQHKNHFRSKISTEMSGSEHAIFLSGLDHFPLNWVKDKFDYIALGHIHKRMTLSESPPIIYPGSPIPMRFSESNKKHLSIITIEEGSSDFKYVEIPIFRRLEQLKLTPENFESKIQETIKKESDCNTPLPSYLEVLMHLKEPTSGLADRIRDLLSNTEIELLSYIPKIDNSKEQSETNSNINQFNIEELFDKYYQFKYGDNKVPAEIKNSFHQLIDSIMQDGDSNENP